MAIRFVYFDLGKVIVDFQVELMLRQVAEVAGCDIAQVQNALFSDSLIVDLETGRIPPERFFESFCERVDRRCDFGKLAEAASDIFTPIDGTLRIIESLAQHRFPIGVLSNTSKPHWEHILRKYDALGQHFKTTALSFELGCLKPDAEIYHKAADLAGCDSAEIFFVDDRAENVAAARLCGYTAVQFTDPTALARSLCEAGVKVDGI